MSKAYWSKEFLDMYEDEKEVPVEKLQQDTETMTITTMHEIITLRVKKRSPEVLALALENGRNLFPFILEYVGKRTRK